MATLPKPAGEGSGSTLSYPSRRSVVSCQAEFTESAKFAEAAEGKNSPKNTAFLLRESAVTVAPHPAIERAGRAFASVGRYPG